MIVLSAFKEINKLSLRKVWNNKKGEQFNVTKKTCIGIEDHTKLYIFVPPSVQIVFK
jgi:hypothetical protein